MKTNKRLDYTLIAEGYAEYAFIPTYLRLIALQHQVQAVKSNIGFKGQNAGKSKVLKEAEPMSTTAILQNHRLIVIGVDLDTTDHEREQPKHTAECDLVKKALGKIYRNYSDRIIPFVTIQAIEQWLTYQAYKIGLAEKFSENSQESRQQIELKKMLYGSKENGPNMDRVAEKIALAADFNELAKQSRSFAHFHKQVIDFLDKYSKQQ